jgi:putative transposase
MGRLTHRTAPGATYFVTTNAWQGISVFQVHEVAEILIRKILEYRDKNAYSLHEFVVMPDHLHLLLTPAGSTSLEKAIQLIKGGSSFEIHKARQTHSQIWQSGFHESRTRDYGDYIKQRDYIHFNPVVAKLVVRPEDWPFGSASGRFPLDPILQGLKPHASNQQNVGPKGPTPKTLAAKAGKS